MVKALEKTNTKGSGFSAFCKKVPKCESQTSSGEVADLSDYAGKTIHEVKERRVCVCVCVSQRKTKDRADGMREKSAHCPRRDWLPTHLVVHSFTKSTCAWIQWNWIDLTYALDCWSPMSAGSSLKQKQGMTQFSSSWEMLFNKAGQNRSRCTRQPCTLFHHWRWADSPRQHVHNLRRTTGLSTCVNAKGAVESNPCIPHWHRRVSAESQGLPLLARNVSWTEGLRLTMWSVHDASSTPKPRSHWCNMTLLQDHGPKSVLTLRIWVIGIFWSLLTITATT